MPWDEKANARQITASFLSRLAEAGRPVIPRVNSLETGLLADDLKALVGPYLFGVSVGKADNPGVLHAIEGILEHAERSVGLEKGYVKLVPWIESAEAVVRAYEMCKASPRIVAVAFGAEDYTTDMAIERSGTDAEIAHPRGTIGVAARAARVQAIDTPFFSFRDEDGLREDCRVARTYGFTGKFAIHPSQITPINESFSPTAAQIEQARLEVVAFEEAARTGRGSTSLDGKLVDVPVYKRAMDLLERAEPVETPDTEAE